MNSSKNMIVAILLLGVSYGVYQVLTSPAQTVTPDTELTIRTPPKRLAAPSSKLTAPATNQSLTPAEKENAMLGKPAPLPTNPSGLPEFPVKQLEKATSQEWNKPEVDPNTNQKSETPGLMAGPTPAPSLKNSDSQFTKEILTKPGSDFPTETPRSDLQPIVPKSEFSAGAGNRSDLRDANSMARPAAPALTPSTQPKPVPQPSPEPTEPLPSVLTKAEQLCADNNFRDALEILTPYYRSQNLDPENRATLLNWLDGLAAKVIFSTEHHLAAPHQVKANETLDTLSKEWNVSASLIWHINSKVIPNPLSLQENTELKKVTGPFHAEVNCREKTLTLFVDNLYACRYDITNCDPNLPSGTYRVIAKSPRNPAYGTHVVTLESEIVMFADEGKSVTRSITFSENDAKELSVILSWASTVQIR